MFTVLLVRVKNPTRGVKQGGILAPNLFSLSTQEYVDMNKLETGGVFITINNTTLFINTIVYNNGVLNTARSQ